MGIGRDHYGDITMNPAPESTSPGAEALELRYLGRLAFEVGAVSLSGIDPALTTNDPRERLRLEAVYTRLRTRTLDTVDREPSSGSDPARGLREGRDALSALAMLDRSPRLVLLGGPGSGKSTFLNFVALCQAGERLGLAEVAARRLTRTSYPGEVAGGATSGVWALAERLCFREPDAPEATLEDAWGAHLAGQAVVESGALKEEAEFKYPYLAGDDREDLESPALRVLRGGAFDGAPEHVRCAVRYRYEPGERSYVIGFRVVVSPFPL